MASINSLTAITFSRRQFISMLGLGGLTAMAGLVGCSGQASESASTTAAATTEAATSAVSTTESATSAASTTEAAATAAASTAVGGKTLVAYYSARGHTARVAEAIAGELGADLFEIVPADPYSDEDLNYNDDASRVCREYADESLRDTPLAQTTPDGWGGYDRVLVGYPIWWGIAAWPTNHFVSDNDFTDKTVMPFCTSGSSGLGESGQLLAELAGTGDWAEGMRFQSNVEDAEVVAWAQGL